MSRMPKYTNELINEPSLYLQQHAHNPVNWIPWSKKAFEIAKTEDKLVLVSIGYSACHWCHVMEHESFENEEVAHYMNEHFICIKVDREEHPDVDEVYMTAVQLMTKQGGWPLNCFTDKDGKPIFGGTYFKNQEWMHVLKSLVKTKEEDPQRIVDFANKLDSAVAASNSLISLPKAKSRLNPELVAETIQYLSKSFDKIEGGHHYAPKFPMPVEWNFYLNSLFYQSNLDLEKQLQLTLDKMISGALYDQLEGGFARYSVDAKWKIPHFEKMLYDNGQLISLYSKAYKWFKDEKYLTIAQETASFLANEFYDVEHGAFYAAMDADSDGEEGKYYVLTQEDLEQFDIKELEVLEQFFAIKSKGYWEENKHVLMRGEARDSNEVLNPDIIKKLKDIRDKKTKPGIDKKLLTSWNAIAYLGLIDLYEIDGNAKWLNLLNSGVKFFSKYIESEKNEDQIWRYYHPEKKIKGKLEDYSFYIAFLIRYSELTGDFTHLKKAEKLVRTVEQKFRKSEDQVFFYSSDITDTSNALFQYSLDSNDNVIPSANSLMYHNYWKMAVLTDNENYRDKVIKCLNETQSNLVQYPNAYFNWWDLYQKVSNEFYSVVILGNSSDQEYLKAVKSNWPNAIFIHKEKEIEYPKIFSGKKLAESLPAFYVCKQDSCIAYGERVDLEKILQSDLNS